MGIGHLLLQPQIDYYRKLHFSLLITFPYSFAHFSVTFFSLFDSALFWNSFNFSCNIIFIKNVVLFIWWLEKKKEKLSTKRWPYQQKSEPVEFKNRWAWYAIQLCKERNFFFFKPAFNFDFLVASKIFLTNDNKSIHTDSFWLNINIFK